MTDSEITSDDKLWAALGYPITIIALIMLFVEGKKDRPFIKFHAVQSLALAVALFVISVVISVVTLGIGSVCVTVIWLVTLWPAIEAYNGKYLELPVIGPFIKKQGWV